jgi:hypothetical protein
MATQPNLSLNQFKMQPVLGMQALGIGSFPIVKSVVVSPNQATTLTPGQAIMFDTTVDQNGIPAIISATGEQYADGYLLYSLKNGGLLFTTGDICEILQQGAMWMMCEGTTIDQGNQLQDGADAGGMAPYATTGYYSRGVALDYATGAGTLFRADLTPFTVKSAASAAHA